MISAKRCLSSSSGGRYRPESAKGLIQNLQERRGPIKTRNRVDRLAVRVEDIMNAVPGQSPFDFAAIAEIDRYTRHGPDRLPMQNEVLTQELRHRGVGVQSRAEESAVGATEFVGQITEQSQRQYRFAGCTRGCFGLFDVGVPV